MIPAFPLNIWSSEEEPGPVVVVVLVIVPVRNTWLRRITTMTMT